MSDNVAETITLVGVDEGFKKYEFVVGTARFRVVAFDDGAFRVWDIASIRPSGANSVILSPYRHESARQMAREEDKS